MSQHFEVGVYTTQKLYDHCESDATYGFQARDVAKDIIEGAFGRWKHSVDINLSDNPVNAPKEGKGGPFQAELPCNRMVVSWNDLRDWWEYWTKESKCTDTVSGRDCHVLLTNASVGGLGTGAAAIVTGGFKMAKQFNSYEKYGYEDYHKKAKNLLHEVGHNLTYNMVNKDDGTKAHDSARIYDHTGNPDHLPKSENTISVMGIDSTGVTDDTQNNCADQTYWYTNKPKYYGTGSERVGWELRYSPCTEQNVEARPR